MATTIASIVRRVTHVTKDHGHVRWSLGEIRLWLNDAVAQIASAHPRSTADRHVVLLQPGVNQDLRVVAPDKQWIRIFDLICNVRFTDGQNIPDGRSIRRIDRPALDRASPTWRSRASGPVLEWSSDEREPFIFDVYPPAAAGTRVLTLASVRPPECMDLTGDGTALANPSELFPLAAGYEIPATDYVLFRCFNKDANDQSYTVRAANHLQAFQMALGVETADAQRPT